MKIYLTVFLFFLSLSSWGQSQNPAKREIIGKDIGQLKEIKISGRLTDIITGYPLVSAVVLVPELNLTLVTDSNGEFELLVDRAKYNFQFRFVGYETINYPITAVGDGKLRIRMEQVDFQLEDVVIFGRDPERNIRSTEMGATTLTMNTLRELPPFLGEVDILKSLTSLPGVSQVGESSIGINVRGGGADQNLIQFAGSPIYNPSHMFGLFTSLNSDVVNDLTLYKAVIPAKFGGRSSAILDITPKAGSDTKWGGNLNLSNFSGGVSINGPILKNKISMQGGFRISYINWLLSSLSNSTVKNSKGNFYDGNLIINAPLSESNELTYSFYRSYDDFAFASDTTISWKNEAHSIQWKSRLTPKLALEALGYYSLYDYGIFNQSGISDFEINSSIQDRGLKFFLGYNFSETNKVTFGGDFKQVNIQPGELIPSGSNLEILPKKVQNEVGQELGIHFQHEFEMGEKIGLSYGIRYDKYRYLGPRVVRQYLQNQPISDGNATGETQFSPGDVIQTYGGFGPRASFRYSLDKVSSIKMGYTKMYQFIHLISNTAAIAPFDVWKLSDNFLKPQISNQYSLGYFKNYKGNIFETSIEVYYKALQNVVEYKDGATLILQNNLETELIPAEGRAYGLELYVKKNLGQLTGWVSYTYSRSIRRVITPFKSENINNGAWYASNFDKPHDLSVVGNLKLTTTTSISGTFGYSTGRPISIPKAKFEYAGNNLAYFDSRNQERAPDFHRLDLAINFKLKGKGLFFDGDWTFSILNVYGRKNPFSIFFANKFESPPQAFRLAIIGLPLPSLSYAIKI